MLIAMARFSMTSGLNLKRLEVPPNRILRHLGVVPNTLSLAEAFAVPTCSKGTGFRSDFEIPKACRKSVLIALGSELPESINAKAGTLFIRTGQYFGY